MYTLPCLYNAREVAETSTPKFSAKRVFSFLCNADLHQGWTPTRLFEELAIDSVGRMKHVTIHVTTENFEHVLELVEAWHEIDMPVRVEFPPLSARPEVGNSVDHRFFGLDVESCYLPRGGTWKATPELKELIADLLCDDRITVVV